MLALFTGGPQGARATTGYHRAAFRTDGKEPLAFLTAGPDHRPREGQAPVRVFEPRNSFLGVFY
jgi:hypothetical protein